MKCHYLQCEELAVSDYEDWYFGIPFCEQHETLACDVFNGYLKYNGNTRESVMMALIIVMDCVRLDDEWNMDSVETKIFDIYKRIK